MASVINGTNIILYYYDPETLEGIPFAAATNCSFDVTVDQLEVTCQSSAWYKEFKNDMASWSISADGFIALSTDYNYLFFLELQQNRIPITIKFQIDNDNADGSGDLGYTVISGNANLTSINLSGSVEGAATYSVNLQGTGAYTVSGTQVTPGGIVVVGSNVVMYDYTAVGGESSITWTGTIGLGCVSVSRGGGEVREILTSGTPTGDQVKFTTSTGIVTFGRTLEAGEFIRGLFK